MCQCLGGQGSGPASPSPDFKSATAAVTRRTTYRPLFYDYRRRRYEGYRGFPQGRRTQTVCAYFRRWLCPPSSLHYYPGLKIGPIICWASYAEGAGDLHFINGIACLSVPRLRLSTSYLSLSPVSKSYLRVSQCRPDGRHLMIRGLYLENGNRDQNLVC